MVTQQEDAKLYKLANELVDRYFAGPSLDINALPAKSQLYSFLAYARNHPPEKVIADFVRHQRQRAQKSRKVEDQYLEEWYRALEEDFLTGGLARLVESQLPPAPRKPGSETPHKKEALEEYRQAVKHWEQQRSQLMAKYYPIYARHIVCHYFYRLACSEAGIFGGEA